MGLPAMPSKALWSLIRTQKIKTVLTPTPLKKILLEKKEHQKKRKCSWKYGFLCLLTYSPS